MDKHVNAFCDTYNIISCVDVPVKCHPGAIIPIKIVKDRFYRLKCSPYVLNKPYQFSWVEFINNDAKTNNNPICKNWEEIYCKATEYILERPDKISDEIILLYSLYDGKCYFPEDLPMKKFKNFGVVVEGKKIKFCFENEELYKVFVKGYDPDCGAWNCSMFFSLPDLFRVKKDIIKGKISFSFYNSRMFMFSKFYVLNKDPKKEYQEFIDFFGSEYSDFFGKIAISDENKKKLLSVSSVLEELDLEMPKSIPKIDEWFDCIENKELPAIRLSLEDLRECGLIKGRANIPPYRIADLYSEYMDAVFDEKLPMEEIFKKLDVIRNHKTMTAISIHNVIKFYDVLVKDKVISL
jgi:hypothetical protein